MRRIATGAIAMSALLGLLTGCTGGAKDATENVRETPTVASSNGDSCTDAKGDLDVGTLDDPSVLASLAGIDLTEASARPNGDVLEVRFTTAGPINLVPSATFIVAQGNPFQPLSYELRAVKQGDAWQVVLVTWDQAEQRKPLGIAPAVSGNQLSFAVPLTDLPPVASLLQFGTSATVPGGKLVIDECSSLTAPSTATSTTVATTASTSAAGSH